MDYVTLMTSQEEIVKNLRAQKHADDNQNIANILERVKNWLDGVRLGRCSQFVNEQAMHTIVVDLSQFITYLGIERELDKLVKNYDNVTMTRQISPTKFMLVIVKTIIKKYFDENDIIRNELHEEFASLMSTNQ